MAGVVGGGGPAWPVLREDILLHPGPVTTSGAPTWTLHDPAAQRFYRLGWMEMEILQRWPMGSPEAIAMSICRETTLMVRPEQVQRLAEFLTVNSLLRVDTVDGAKALAAARSRRAQSYLTQILHTYLFIRIPLVRPDRFLTATLPSVRWIFTTPVFVLTGLLALLAAYLISRQWDMFKDTFASMFTVTGALLAAAVLGLSKVVHELGHAYAAKSLGLRVPSMGVSLMCFAPVLWTDTTEAWKLPRRSQRLRIGVAGVTSELMLATFAALLWPLMPPGHLKTAVFIAAGTIWIMTLAVNANPCMRYDGYYLLSDYWDIPDLQSRAFAMGKWRMREWLFGLGMQPPERWPAWDREKLIIYAYCTWVYRFFLFLGIALMMYHFLFKALGIVLMLAELVFFLAAPVWKEIMQWYALRGQFHLTFRLVRTALAAALFAAFFFYPWHRQIVAPAVLVPSRQTMLFSPGHGRLEQVEAENFHLISRGQQLAQLTSPDLENRILTAENRIASQMNALSLASLDRQLRADLASEWEEMARLAEDLGGLLKERSELSLRAPLDGTVRDMPVWIAPGQWLAAKEPVALVAGESMRVEAYIAEDEWERIQTGHTGLFYPAGRGRQPLAVTVALVEPRSTRTLPMPELSSTNGGPLAAYRSADGDLIPDHAVFRVICEVENGAPSMVVSGQVSLRGEPRSFAGTLWRNFLGLLVRESNLN